MILAERIYSWAIRRLHLQEAGFEFGDAQTALADTVVLLQQLFPTQTSEYEITTVAATGEYMLPESFDVIRSIKWPGDWDDSAIVPVTLDQIERIRAGIGSGTQDYETNQPNWYAFTRGAAGRGKFILERAASIAVGLTVTIAYYKLEYKVILESNDQSASEAAEIDMPANVELALKCGTTWHLAEVYKPEVATYYKGRFDELMNLYKSRATWPDLTAKTREAIW